MFEHVQSQSRQSRDTIQCNVIGSVDLYSDSLPACVPRIGLHANPATGSHTLKDETVENLHFPPGDL